MADDSKKLAATQTLNDEDIVTEKDVPRRKMLGFAAVGAASAVALATGCGRRRVVRVQTVQTVSGITDRDAGQYADPAGNGRGTTQVVVQQASGITDSDSGQYADPAGNGRGGVVVQGTGVTDNDSGPCADPGGGGRGYSGLTDSDGGTCSDPGGRGRSGY
jgi:hypothetical protein